MTKVVKLTVHKNTLAKRRRKEMRDRALATIKEAFTDNNVTAFALVAIDDNENSVTISDGGTLSPSQFAVLLRQALDEETMTAPAPEREADGDG